MPGTWPLERTLTGMQPLQITKIISGGQTGADRAGLDFAIKHDIPHGGWIPKGRKTEEGKLPEQYQLQEMPTDVFRCQGRVRMKRYRMIPIEHQKTTFKALSEKGLVMLYKPAVQRGAIGAYNGLTTDGFFRPPNRIQIESTKAI